MKIMDFKKQIQTLKTLHLFYYFLNSDIRIYIIFKS